MYRSNYNYMHHCCWYFIVITIIFEKLLEYYIPQCCGYSNNFLIIFGFLKALNEGDFIDGKTYM